VKHVVRTHIVFSLEFGMTVLLGGLLALTLVRRDRIEAVLGVDPDQHNGSLERIIVAALAAAVVTFALLARRQWRHVASAPRPTMSADARARAHRRRGPQFARRRPADCA
jgi:hypothetical protein